MTKLQILRRFRFALFVLAGMFFGRGFITESLLFFAAGCAVDWYDARECKKEIEEALLTPTTEE